MARLLGENPEFPVGALVVWGSGADGSGFLEYALGLDEPKDFDSWLPDHDSFRRLSTTELLAVWVQDRLLVHFVTTSVLWPGRGPVYGCG